MEKKNSQGVVADPNAHISNTTSANVKGKEFENMNPNPEDLEDRWLRWKCLNCNFVYEGKEPLQICPKCGNSDPDKFDDAF